MIIQPPPTPPVPTEAPMLPGSHQVSPYLLLHPVLDEAEATARVPDGKVPDPATQDRVDEGHHPSQRLGLKEPADAFAKKRYSERAYNERQRYLQQFAKARGLRLVNDPDCLLFRLTN